MLCSNRKCMMAMDAENEKQTHYVGSTWDFDLLEGEMEGWVCIHCGSREVTRMIKGVREDAKLLFVWEEVEV